MIRNYLTAWQGYLYMRVGLWLFSCLFGEIRVWSAGGDDDEVMVIVFGRDDKAIDWYFKSCYKEQS